MPFQPRLGACPRDMPPRDPDATQSFSAPQARTLVGKRVASAGCAVLAMARGLSPGHGCCRLDQGRVLDAAGSVEVEDSRGVVLVPWLHCPRELVVAVRLVHLPL